MRTRWWVLVLGVVIPAFAQLPGQAPPAPRKSSDALAVNGGVELVEVRLTRHRKGRILAGLNETKNSLEVALWFPHRWTAKPDYFVYHIRELGPVEDDTGETLSGGRPAKADGRPRVIRSSESMSLLEDLARNGPLYRLVLPCPARTANTLKSLRGSVDVWAAASRPKTLDRAVKAGEFVADEGCLKDSPVRFVTTVADGKTRVVAKAPSPVSPLIRWDLVDDGRIVQGFGERSAFHPEDSSSTTSRDYLGEPKDTWRYQLLLAEPFETKAFSFEFRDVALP